MLREFLKRLRTKTRRHAWEQERYQPKWLQQTMFTKAHKYVGYICYRCGTRIVVADVLELQKKQYGCTGEFDDRETTDPSRAEAFLLKKCRRT